MTLFRAVPSPSLAEAMRAWLRRTVHLVHCYEPIQITWFLLVGIHCLYVMSLRRNSSLMMEELYVQWQADWEPDPPEQDADERECDPVIDEAKQDLRQFFAAESGEIFYQRQLLVIFERKYFHWITARALSELTAEGHISSDEEFLAPKVPIVFYRAKSHRYWRKQAKEIKQLVRRFSDQSFTEGLGAQGELMFEAALAATGFKPIGRKVGSYGGKSWTAGRCRVRN